MLFFFFFPYPTGILFQLALSHGGLKCVLKFIQGTDVLGYTPVGSTTSLMAKTAGGGTNMANAFLLGSRGIAEKFRGT